MSHCLLRACVTRVVRQPCAAARVRPCACTQSASSHPAPLPRRHSFSTSNARARGICVEPQIRQPDAHPYPYPRKTIGRHTHGKGAEGRAAPATTAASLDDPAMCSRAVAKKRMRGTSWRPQRRAEPSNKRRKEWMLLAGVDEHVGRGRCGGAVREAKMRGARAGGGAQGCG